MRSRVLGLALAAVLVSSGCSSDSGLSERAAKALQADVAKVSEAVSSRDRAAALKALAALRDEVSAQLAAGEISGERAQRILTAARDVAADLPPAPAPRATRSATPAPVPERKEEQNKGEGNEDDKDEQDGEEKKGDDKGDGGKG